MTNYRNSKLIEIYEDVVFELDAALISVLANGAHQKKEGHRFVVDHTGERTPLDWYHARFNVDFNLKVLADGADVAAADQQGIVNSSHSLIKKLNVKMNGVDVYDCDDANHATNIKNLIEYSKGYSQCQGTKEFFYLDSTRNAETREFEVSGTNQLAKRRAGYNSGFAARKSLLNGADGIVNAEIPLNRYGFFEALHGEMLPNSRVELNIALEDDNNLVWRAGGADCREVLTKFQLIVPSIIFNDDGMSLYMEKYLNARK